MFLIEAQQQQALLQEDERRFEDAQKLYVKRISLIHFPSVDGILNS
jgi:hypothetical protein